MSNDTPDAATARLAGRATPEGTAAYAQHAENGFAVGARALFAPFGNTGLTASRIGFGGYRVSSDQREHAEAMMMSLIGGANLIDTSSNYTDGSSEELIGQAMRGLADEGGLRREQVIVVTKGGYIQGANMKIAQERAASGAAFQDVVEYMDICWHCLHPDFLADQLARSLGRLGLETIDVYLLHNPEYFLTDIHEKKGAVTADDRAEYERRLRGAFEWLETQVSAGTIARYGISSNTFVAPADHPEYTSLSRCWEMACEVGGGAEAHHFRVVQMPGNLIETGFARCANQPDGSTPAEFCEKHGLAMLLNRPLNAFTEAGGLIRLAGVPALPEVDEESFRSAMAAMIILEDELKSRIEEDGEAGSEVRRLLRHGSFLRDHWEEIEGREHWKQTVELQLVPMAQYGLSLLKRLLGPEANGGAGDAIVPGAVSMADDAAAAGETPLPQRYLATLNELLRRGFAWFSQTARAKSEARRERLAGVLRPALEANDEDLDIADPMAAATLSQLAIMPLLRQPGTPVVLVGMRQKSYVQDVMGCFRGALGGLAETAPADLLDPAHDAMSVSE